MKIDLSCPALVKTLSFNKEEKAVVASFLNISPKTITEMKYTVLLFDAENNKLAEIPASLDEIALAPRENITASISYEDAQNAETAEIIFNEFTFDDETVFVPTGEFVEPQAEELSEEENARFIRAGLNDACCYAKDESSYWLCVCGRPNHKASETCVNCEREKEVVLNKYISAQSLAAAILEKEENDAIEEAKRLEAIKAEKAAKKAAFIKKAKKVVLAAVAVIVAVLIIVFAFKFIVTKIGDSNAAKGDYVKAAKMYQLSGSSKFDDVSDYLYGSSASNLVYMGIMAQDPNNIYFVDNAFSVYKKDKNTGEQTVLEGITGRSLCASGGYLYYLNVQDELVYRTTPDGKTNEVVYDAPVYYFSTVANDVYFITDNPENTEGAETQNPYALYVLKEGETEATFISNKNIGAFTIYKNKIYYIDFADNYALYSMSLDGKNPKKLIDSSINVFEVKNDRIYYTDGSIPENSETGMPTLALVSTNLNGKDKETVVPDAMVSLFSISDDTVYYTDYNNYGTLYKLTKGAEPTVEAESVSLFNASGDYVYYLSNDGGLYMTKLDFTGYEKVASKNETEETAPDTAEEPTE